jgi:hypothetical protein
MSTQRYSVTPHPIETLLTWVKSGEIAIPEIQRPFVWEATKVRNLLDSLYQGYPVGYLIAWRNPTVRLKDGTSSAGKRILIDGQQRVTALMAALLGREVLTKDYETLRIRIAFHPLEERFEVANPAIRKDVAWIEDIAGVFAPDASLTELTDTYSEKNPHADRKRVSRVLEKLRKIINNHVGLIELADDLDIETVTEIFIRVNSAGENLEFLAAVMQQLDYMPWISGAAQPKLTQDRLMSIAIAVPTPEEQQTIVEASASETSTHHAAIDRAHREIKLLGEYRVRLIADVVTGRLDVSEPASLLPDEAEASEPLDAADACLVEEDPTPDDTDEAPEEAEA